MNNAILGQILGSVFANAAGRRNGGGLGGGLGGLGGGLGGAALGGILAGALGRRGAGAARSGGGGRSAMLLLLLPLAMRWVQRNGGIGAVLERFQQKGFGAQAKSWVDTGDNQQVDAEAVNEVVGRDELSRLSQQLGMPEQEVAQGFAEILPEMVNQLTPQGSMPEDADHLLEGGTEAIEQELEAVKRQDAGVS
ncbi:MAG: YidB family protein [Pseudomonadota bacterium]